MRIINNKKGSAILWCVLMTVIITILLGAITTAAFAYYNYTMYSVKRQQAYFTCRSFVDAVIDTLSNQEETDSSAIPVPNKDNPEYDITNVKFYKATAVDNQYEELSTLGKISDAKLSFEEIKSQEVVKINVTSEYADEEYSMEAVIAKQPLYFAGISLKNLTLETDLTLGQNTDLYYNNDTDAKTFESKKNGHYITIYGNLVTKHDAKVYEGTVVAGHTMSKNVMFTNTGRYKKHIWNASQYILSNTTLKVIDGKDNVEYNSTFIKDVSSITSSTYAYCNNNLASREYSFGSVDLLQSVATAVEDIPLIGTLSGGLAKGSQAARSWLTSMLAGTELGNLIADSQNSTSSLEDSSTDANSIRYIKLLSLSNYIEQQINAGSSNLIKAIMDWMTAGGQLNLGMMDISYIGFDSTNQSTWSDNVIPVVYLFVDDGLVVRVRYGQDPANQSLIGGALDDLENTTDQLLSKYLNINQNLAYVIVYLGAGSEIELGCTVGMDLATRNQDDLIFAYSIYGEDNSTVILNDGVTVLGEIICDNLKVVDKKGTGNGVNVVYSTSNGSQVAKQKVDEFWTVLSYDS